MVANGEITPVEMMSFLGEQHDSIPHFQKDEHAQAITHFQRYLISEGKKCGIFLRQIFRWDPFIKNGGMFGMFGMFEGGSWGFSINGDMTNRLTNRMGTMQHNRMIIPYHE